VHLLDFVQLNQNLMLDLLLVFILELELELEMGAVQNIQRDESCDRLLSESMINKKDMIQMTRYLLRGLNS